MSESPPPEPPPGMSLVWSDEFDGDGIDDANWTYDLGGGGWGNGEAQWYTDRPENARVEDGNLVIELLQERYEDGYYTSARMLTKGLQEFKYGYIEARVKVPSGVGTWPAFWMLGADFDQASSDDARHWPNVGEIDVMEYVGRDPDLVMGTIHGPGYAGAGGLTTWHRVGEPVANDFHRFAIDWNADRIIWYFDGKEFARKERADVGDRDWVFDRDFFLIVNLALGGTLGGNIDMNLEFPQQLIVDYVRVYQVEE